MARLVTILRWLTISVAIISSLALVIWAIGFPFVFGYTILGGGGWRAYWFFAGILILPVTARSWVAR